MWTVSKFMFGSSVFIVLTAIEMATFQLVTIWFAVGAVAAFITFTVFDIVRNSALLFF